MKQGKLGIRFFFGIIDGLSVLQCIYGVTNNISDNGKD